MRSVLKYGWLMMLVTLVACKNEYERKVAEQLSTGKRYDSLFLGLSLGMTSKEFYAKCWDMNRKGLIKEGSGNTSVLYKINDTFRHPVAMNFYPNFKDDKINLMTCELNFEGWSPWNKELSSDSLLIQALEVCKKWYGGEEFIKVEHPTRGPAFVKIDGNRRISLFRKNDTSIRMLYLDLTQPLADEKD